MDSINAKNITAKKRQKKGSCAEPVLFKLIRSYYCRKICCCFLILSIIPASYTCISLSSSIPTSAIFHTWALPHSFCILSSVWLCTTLSLMQRLINLFTCLYLFSMSLKMNYIYYSDNAIVE